MKSKAKNTLDMIRLITGLVLMFYAFGHLLNHALGLVSIAAMDWGRAYFMGFWRAPVLYWVVPISLVLHMVMAIASLLARRSLRERGAVVNTQIVLGLMMPMLLFMHIGHTRWAFMQTGREAYYANMFLTMVATDMVPMGVFFLTFMMAIVWGHGCLGIHRWLSTKAWYRRTWALWHTAAMLPLLLAFAGSLSGIREAQLRSDDATWLAQAAERTQWLDANGAPMKHELVDAAVEGVAGGAIACFLGLVLLGFAVRAIWLAVERRRATVGVRYSSGAEFKVCPGTTVLETSRLHGVPHASICGGDGRCSICRTRVIRGIEHLPPPNEQEAKVLARIAAAPNIRLACQIRPTESVVVHPMLQQASFKETVRRPSYVDGREIDVTVMFADLRGFTKLSDKRLPYDVVFILNQYFELMGEAIELNDGYLDKFIGDGIMAIFGMRSGTAIGARQALGASIEMSKRLDELNQRLEHEVSEPLRIGIGLHRGKAIVGRMGYGDAMDVTAIGSTVNTAARLEGTSKELGAELVVSQDVLDAAEVDLPGVEASEVAVRGQEAAVRVYGVERAATLEPERRSAEASVS